MNDARGYRYGLVFFAIAVVCSAVAVIYGSYCCASFSVEDQAFRAKFGLDKPRDGMWLTRALMDWPLGFRLCLMTLVTSVIGFAVAFFGFLLARREGAKHGRLEASFRSLSAVLLVGVIYILIVYVDGFFGYRGPVVLLSWMATALLVGLMSFPQKSGVVLAVPLMFVGFGSAALISMTMGIPWD